MLLVGLNSYSQVTLVDDYFNVPSCQWSGTIIGNVLENDSIDGNNFLSSDYSVQIDFISFVGFPHNNAATLNLDNSGNITNQSSVTISGIATIHYSVYSIVDPSLSWTATALIEFFPLLIIANDDIFNYSIGGNNNYLNVLYNDTKCDIPILSPEYVCNFISALPDGVSLNLDGEVVIDEVVVLPGVYTIDYQATSLDQPNFDTGTLTLTIVPNCISTITPNFAPIAPICSGATLSVMPTTSTNGIVGTWSPTLNNLATTTYTFTPNSGQCADSISMTIIVNPITVPNFTPIAPICSGTTASPLPTTSTNGITGTWLPVFNGSTSATYTFTPNAGQCATSTTLNIIVNGFTTATVCLHASKDAMIHQYEPNRNYGSNTVLQPSRWTYDGDWNTTKVLHQFDLSAIPSGAIITNAEMKLHVDTTDLNYNQHRDLEFMGNGAIINEVGILWSENTVTWNTAPFLTATTPVSVPSLGNGSIADVVANLTTMVQNMYASGINNGFQISMANNLDHYRSLVFGSRENTNSGGIYQPELCVTYTTSSGPVFTQIAPICQGTTVSPLPTTSLNGVSGTWSPALNNAATTTYTFTPNAGQCATTASMTIVVNNAITSQIINVSTGIDNAGSALVAGSVDPNWHLVSSPNPLGTPALVSDYFLPYWEPTPITPSNAVWINAAGNYYSTVSGIYTFERSFTVGVGTTNIDYNLGIAWDAFPISTEFVRPDGSTIPFVTNPPDSPYYLSTSIPSSLPMTTMAGVWKIRTVSNFTDIYSGFLLSGTITVTTDTSLVPTFSQITPICSGTALSLLPTTSLNGISGTWSPALNNAATTTYTFTPNAGQCSSTATMTIVVDPQTLPTFFPIGPFCQNSSAPTLLSISNNSITGTWFPSNIDTNQAGTYVYMFTPDAGQCAMQTAISITINPVITPSFTALNPITVNSVAPSLPTTSNNSITGTWFPAVINTSVVGSFIYTFTPDSTIAGQECALTTTMVIDIVNCITTTIKSTFWNTTGLPNRYIINQPVVLPSGSTITKHGVEVTNMTSNAVGTFEYTASNFRIIDASPLVASYGTSFSVRVKLQINGVWQCYGIAKIVSTPALPLPAGINSYCGQTLPTINKVIYCTVVPLATSYLFEISQLTSTGTLTTTYSNTLNNFKLTDLDFNTFPILFNKTYSVRTKVKTMVNGVEVESAWSSPCSITTPATPPAVTMISGCGSVASNLTLIKCTTISNANEYKFDIVSSTATFSITRPFNSFSLSLVSGIVPTTAYTVTPSYKLYGQWYTGSPCSLTSPAVAPVVVRNDSTMKQQQVSSDFTAKAYPNPFAESFKLNVTSATEDALQIKVYDMLGKLVEVKELNLSDIETLEVGTNYTSGVYNLVISQGENIQSLHIIKR